MMHSAADVLFFSFPGVKDAHREKLSLRSVCNDSLHRPAGLCALRLRRRRCSGGGSGGCSGSGSGGGSGWGGQHSGAAFSCGGGSS